MKLKQVLLSAVALSLIAGVPGGAGADDATPPQPLQITADTLAALLIKNDGDVINEMTAVLKARDEVNMARSQLLPSLNLNLSLLLSANPTFFIQTATCLVPFIFPQKWFDLKAADKNYSAEVYALHITRLNAYATAWTLAARLASDEQTAQIMSDQQKRLADYVSGLQVQKTLGLISDADVIRGQMSMTQGQTDLSKVQTIIIDERATMRKMLGLPLTQDFVIALGQDAAPSVLESANDVQDLNPVLERAPERTQLNLLLASMKDKVKSAEWAFLVGCSGSEGSVGTAPGTPNAFSLSSGIDVNIGYGLFPSVSLAKRDVQDVINRQTQLKLELGRILESTLSELQVAQGQGDFATKSAAMGEQMYQDQLQLFQLGKASVKDILDALASVTQAKLQKVSSDAAVTGDRIALKRIGLEGQFLDVLIQSRRQFEVKKH
jgi:outer membrane protein TolC